MILHRYSLLLPALATLMIVPATPSYAFDQARSGNSGHHPRSALPPGVQVSAQARGRPVADHDHARQSTRSGENRSFEELMRAAQSRGRGEYLGVEPDIGRNIYRFKFLRPGGNVVWVDVDGRTGRVVAERN